MAEDNKNKPIQKRGFPGGFLILILAAVLTLFSISSMN
jgi:hypothetical protein